MMLLQLQETLMTSTMTPVRLFIVQTDGSSTVDDTETATTIFGLSVSWKLHASIKSSDLYMKFARDRSD